MKFIVRQKIFSLGDSFTITDETGNGVYIVKSKLLTIGKKLRIYDLMENELCYIEQRLFRLMPEYNIFFGGEHVANIKKRFALLKNDFDITGEAGHFQVEGNIFAYNFNILKDGITLAFITKQFLQFTDTYLIDIEDSKNQLLLLAFVIVMDMACHQKNK
jgi:uncharacterized protein YxjI